LLSFIENKKVSPTGGDLEGAETKVLNI